MDDFSAYYTKITSGAELEIFDRTGNYPDIIVNLGALNGKFIFWRGASYLPYWVNDSGKKFYVEEVVQRNGDGSDIMPDRNNTYSHVKIISISNESVVIHWRYLPTFVGGNPHLGVEATNFVDEYFTINPNGKVIRTIKQGTVKIDDWRDPSNMICLLYTSPSPRDGLLSRMPSSA